MTTDQTLTILDVGHGNSAVFTDPEGTVVIDAGPKAGLLQYLHEQEISRVDVVLISHADEDHIGGLIGILASGEIEIKHVRLNTDSLQGSAIWDDLLYELDHAAGVGATELQISLTSSDSGLFDRGDVSIEILGPSPYLAARGPGQRYRGSSGPRLTTNSVSAVIRVSKGGRPIALLPGDLDDIGLNDLVSHGIEAVAPVLVFPHHGGLSGGRIDAVAFARKLCSAVKPRTVLFSIGRSGRYQTPRPEIISAIRSSSHEVRIACTQLSEQCANSLPADTPTHLNEVFAKGREYRKCCAGSLVIELEESRKLFPIYSDHQEFIASEAPTALCRANH